MSKKGSNRAIQMADGKIGTKNPVHPNSFSARP
jgi:hypothetical protein